MSWQSVLIIDDDPTQIAILSAYFAGMRIEQIYGAGNAAKALSILQEHKDQIDLVVSDLQMPEMDGLEFFRHLSATKYKGQIAIVSGVQEMLLEHASRLAKMHNLKLIGHIQKPISKPALDLVFARNSQSFETLQDDKKIVLTQGDFSNALAENEIYPVFQPKIDGASGDIVGAESLARWYREGIGYISPEIFIEFAEQNGRIEELTFYLFNKTLDAAKSFLEVLPEQNFATNLAPSLINNVALPDQLANRIKVHNLPSEAFSFEITENSILNLDPTTLEVLSRLRIMEFDVAIDDFGTGSSNIQTLRDFPYSELKIDRSFISNVTTSVFSRETVHAAIALAREQDMRVVAEGVDSMETLKYIREQGVDYIQGFLIAKPMGAEDYLEFIKMHKSGFDYTQTLRVA